MNMAHERLAQEFHAVGDFEAEKKARQGYWGDFTSPLATPQLDLHSYASKKGYTSIAKGVLEGRFDG
jgi:hypothetical protein